ncbi:sugar kinase [Virgibacillus sp. NKC19-3]|uniref:sugar kinase n=1 Tax=Virgibacillus saliphilus TaxID=2831674 RepID=UPI001C9B2CC7|nr:sugar kinase [Virgibacillus sp. NKC19-3]MBY7141764.1 sugar kinase [Virgibacillus sp. NKC19-3]
MDVVTLGESMVLFTPETTGYMRHADKYSSSIAGAESNLAIGLSRLGYNVSWISRLGDDEFGRKVISLIRGEGVETSQVQYDSTSPTGLYFKEILTDEETQVYYYRQNSAASNMIPADLNEEHISKAKFLYLTGITPALSETCYQTVKQAIKIARKHSLTIIFDPNLRRKLWTEERARKVLLELISMVDIVLPGIEEGKFLFGEEVPEKIAKCFYEQGAKLSVLKLGPEGAYYYSKKEDGYVLGPKVDNVVDPVGAGDGFAAGLVSGLLENLPIKEAVKKGTFTGALVIKVKGDIEGLPEKKRLESFMNEANKDDVYR